uniref:Uncharacterized protein n=1 Tax=Pseudomonas putida TaxID=303 RepID=A0A336TQI5_PSEPU|nr:Hypothetical protein [Pseudomonas putida]
MEFQDMSVRSAAEVSELARTAAATSAPLKNPFNRLLLL